jgi:hypothetical protein
MDDNPSVPANRQPKTIPVKRSSAKRPDRSWRTGLRPGAAIWRNGNGQPATFTREELAEKWLLVKEIEQAKGRRSAIARLARAIHAAHRRQSRAAERWLRGQLATLWAPR